MLVWGKMSEIWTWSTEDTKRRCPRGRKKNRPGTRAISLGHSDLFRCACVVVRTTTGANLPGDMQSERGSGPWWTLIELQHLKGGSLLGKVGLGHRKEAIRRGKEKVRFPKLCWSEVSGDRSKSLHLGIKSFSLSLGCLTSCFSGVRGARADWSPLGSGREVKRGGTEYRHLYKEVLVRRRWEGTWQKQVWDVLEKAADLSSRAGPEGAEQGHPPFWTPLRKLPSEPEAHFQQWQIFIFSEWLWFLETAEPIWSQEW